MGNSLKHDENVIFFISWDFYPMGLLSGGDFIRWGFYPLGLLSGGLFSEGLLSVGLLSAGLLSYTRYRDNPSGKSECDRKMLPELNTLIPKGRREKADMLLVRSIIGLKHRSGMGVWSNQLVNELHKPVQRRFDKRTVFAKQVDDIWAADLVDMSPFSR